MSDYLTTDSELTSIANAIRTKGGTSSQLVYPAGFISAIGDIHTGTGTDTSDATLTSGTQMLAGVSAYSQGIKYTGTIPEKTAQSYTPGVSNQVISSGQYLSGDQTIAGDINLVPDNIKKGTSIFGVFGNCVNVSLLENDVTFYDYDGTVVDSYSASDFLNLTELPSNPNHNGLTAQGWNWSLSDAKTYVTTYGRLNIGQMCVTDDGKTRLYINLADERLSPTLQLGLNGTIDVDWGDGTQHGSISGTSLNTEVSIDHTYSTGGNYIISLTVDGTANIITTHLLGSTTYTSAIEKIEMGNNVKIGEYAFSEFRSLKTINIPSSVNAISSSAFSSCISLRHVTIPASVSIIQSSTFNRCYSLKSVSIPSSITEIRESAFHYCYTLKSITLPSYVRGDSAGSCFRECQSLRYMCGLPYIRLNVYLFYGCVSLVSVDVSDATYSIRDSCFYNCASLTRISISSDVSDIGTNAFYSCNGLKEIHFKGSHPPTLSDANVLGSIPSSCIIYVPVGSLSAYTSASNYPSSSRNTYVEE